MGDIEDKIPEAVSVREDIEKYILGEIKLLKMKKAARDVQDELRTAAEDFEIVVSRGARLASILGMVSADVGREASDSTPGA